MRSLLALAILLGWCASASATCPGTTTDCPSPTFNNATVGGTLTLTSGLPVASLSGLGTGVATALGINVGSAGAPVTFNGALGTPSSGFATNLTGTASGLTAGAATTATTATAANGLKSATTTVAVSAATAPTAGQALTATSGTVAAWQNAYGVVVNVQGSGVTTYTFLATDCFATVIFTSNSAVTATIPAALVPASGVGCPIDVIQGGTAKVSVNGTAVSAATLISSHSYTGTNGTQGSVIFLRLATVSAATNAYLTGDGS